MAIRRLSKASITSGAKSSKMWDQETSLGFYESIASAVVDASNTSLITFNNIPQNYTHLQVRITGRSTRDYSGNNIDAFTATFNGGSLSRAHSLIGDGSVASSTPNYLFGFVVDDFAPNSAMYSPIIIDILDYSNTTKLKTTKTIWGVEVNSGTYPYGGSTGLSSGYWNSTTSINSIEFSMAFGGVWKSGSHVALYGIRGA